MADNFLKTAEQMNESSKVLNANSHFHNACYMAGYVAECYLKTLSEKGLGNTPRRTHNLSTLHYEVSSGATLPALFSTYLLDMSLDCPQIYAKWDPAKRYDDSSGWDNHSTSQDFQNEQEKCFRQLAQMRNSGLI